MPAKPATKPKPIHRDMPEDPRQLAKAMFNAADKKIEEGRAAEKPAAQGSGLDLISGQRIK